jgi:multiple antibiotic resistance protein
MPIAFPLIAGAGTMTTLISLKAEFQQINIIIGVVLNLILVFVVLKTCGWLEKKIGQAGFSVLRKVFGIILLAISIKLFKNFF